MKTIKRHFFLLILVLLALMAAGLIFIFSSDIFWVQSGKESEFNYYLIKNIAEEKDEKKNLNFLFFGDLMLDRHVGEKIKKDGLDNLFSALAGEENRFFRGVDLIGANLEGAVTDKGAHYPPAVIYDFAFDPLVVDELKKYNFNFFNLANNHFSDQGERGIMETRSNLSAGGFYYTGCADGQTGDCSKTIMTAGNLKIGLAGFSMVYNKFKLTEAKKIISGLAAQTDLVIVNVHWGTEYQHNFNQGQAAVAHGLIDAGADALIGHHPHVAQGMEIYQGKPIFYSLGNFIFDQYFSRDTEEGLAVGINVENGKMTGYLYPLKSKLSQPQLMAGEERENFLQKIADWSQVDESDAGQIKRGMLIF